MKKIIYSLVIMIAAGSLFTSCIEPVEPAGIYDLREAKARYYDALSKLRAADAALQEANANYRNAQAEHERAITENQNLLNEYQRLVNEAKALDNDKEVAKWELELEKLLKEREILRYQWEAQLAQAKEDLRQALSKIEMAMLDLTDAEKAALTEAITRYEKAFDKYLKAKEAVTKAEAALWSAQYEIDNVCDEDGLFFDYYGEYIRIGMTTPEYYETCVEFYTLYAQMYAQLYEEMAENSDYAAWAAELENLKAQRDEAKYNRYQVTKDSVEYMMNIYHDGVHAYEMAVKAWVEDNPAVADPGKAPKEPKESDFKAADYQADTITFEALEYTTPNAAYDKLLSLLSGYMSAVSPASKADPANNVIINNTTDETLTIVANQAMKDFILGTATSTDLKYEYKDKDGNKQTIKAKYGLNGAVSVLKRILVLSHSTATKEEAKEKADAAFDAWKADRDSIIALYDAQAAKKSVADAYQPLKDALDALKQAKDDATKNGDALVKAAEKLIEDLNGMITHTDMSTADSTNLTKAIAAFGAAREKYLDYTPYENGVKYDNKNLFYYAYSITPDILVDSIAFSELTIDLVREKKGFSYNTDGVEVGADPVKCFYNMMLQMAGTTLATAINGPWAKAKIADATVLNDGTNYTGFYGEYQYVAGDPAQIKKADGSDYTPKTITDAIAAVSAATDELNNLWDRFWKEDLGATCDADGKVTIPTLPDEYDPRTYELASFTEPYNAVVFDGANILWTEAIGAILGSVDPNAGLADGSDLKAGDYVSGAGVFFGTNGNTDFYTYMKALDEYVNFDSTEEIQKIEAWVASVVAAFEADVTNAEAAAKKAYEDAVASYEKTLAKYNEDKAKYDAYMEKLAAFVGYEEDGKTLRPIMTTIGTPDANYQAKGVKQTEVGIYEWEGEWDLAGTQAELAEKYLPKYPENLAEWHTTAVQTDHKIIHLNAIIDELEKAYLAAAAVYDEAYMSFYGFDSIEEYFQDYLDYLQEYYEMCLALASMAEDALAKWNAGYDAAQINIELLEDALALAELKLADAEKELAAAEAYYNAVMAKLGL